MQIYGSHRAQQEREYQGFVWTQASFTSTLPAAFLGLAFVVQQQPDLGRGITQNGIQGPNVQAPVISSVITVREQPGHPLPFFYSTPPTIPASVISAGIRRVFTRQEEPRDRDGYKWLSPGIQGPNVKWPGDTVITRQEPHRDSYTFFQTGATLTALLVPSARNITISTQQLPDHPYPRTLGALTLGATKAPVSDYLFTKQETPFHPVSFTWRGLYGPGARNPIRDVIITRREEPFHPTGFTEGRIRLNVGPPIRRTVFVWQEQDFFRAHPRPFVLPFVSYSKVPHIPLGAAISTAQQQPVHPLPFLRGVDNPNNAIPPQPGIPPLQENLTFDMLGVAVQPNFYTDPGEKRQLLTSINYPHGELAPVGWIPVGGFAYPIGEMYNRDLVPDATSAADWFNDPDLVGGWRTAEENQTGDMLSLQNQQSFFEDPLIYQINPPNSQYYPVGLTPVGGNISPRGLLGVKPYG